MLRPNFLLGEGLVSSLLEADRSPLRPKVVNRSVPYSPENREIIERDRTEFCKTRFDPVAALLLYYLLWDPVFGDGNRP